MARPKNADSEETHARILEAAHAFLRDHDMQELSLRKVAKRAGVSVGTVSYYFTSRDELIEACLDAYYERLQELAQRHIAKLTAGAHLSDIVPDAVREAFRFAMEERTLVRLQMLSIANRGALHDRRREGFQRAFLRNVSQLLAALPSSELRLNVQIISYAAMRFACAGADERMLFTGKQTDDEAIEAIGEHLAKTALALVSGSK